MEKRMKKKFVMVCVLALLVCTVTACGSSGGDKSAGELVIYNWGEYFDPDAIAMFEEETGIHVTYDEYETNEVMYPIIANGAADYDLVCPSDYMVQRMISEGLLEKINFENIPNIKYIDAAYMEASRGFDANNEYSVPYLWGTVGILYNKTMVKEPVDSWGILWDEKYKDNILMQKSVRDAFGITLKYLGYSLNSADEGELEEAKKKLIEQKNAGVVQAYVVDEVRDKMIGNEAAIGVIYSGEALTCQKENPDLEYIVPKEGSNLWFDSWVIPKGAKNKENAEKFLDFQCRPEIAKMNFDFITYSIPNEEGRKQIEEESYRNSAIAFPPLDSLTNCETFQYLGPEVDEIYNEKWKEVMAD